MGERIDTVNGLQICSEARGPADGMPLLLVMGLGAQLVSWPEGFVDGLVERGFRVVRFDNRDVGRSTWFDEEIDIGALFGGTATPPYTLADMAADAIGVMDLHGMATAHIVGASMGGMIVQQMVIDHPHRIASVTSIMSTTGDPDVGQPAEAAMGALMRPAPTDLDGAIAAAHESDAIFGSPDYPDPAAVEARARREWERARNPMGVVRQMAAIVASPSRTEALGAVEVPFDVIHGAADTLVTVSGGLRTAEAVPHATLDVIDGMGHNLPEALWPRILDRIAAQATGA